MDKLKRFIDIWVPVTTCTLRCSYCYITHHRLFGGPLPKYKYDVETFKKGFSKERFGGTCMINMCGGGETLLSPEIPNYVKALLEEGHYVMIVTNGTVDKAFDIFAQFPAEYLERLFFKFSYHYLELKKRDLFDRFFSNIRKMRDAGASFTLEATPSDELIPYIEEMKELAINEVGAINHVTVARDEHNLNEIPILTKMSPKEYYDTWSVFNSSFFDYKFSVFSQKRTEFCYAGDWTLFYNMETGELFQCYASLVGQNIMDDVTKPISFKAIGHYCQQPHCYNAHAFLTFGSIPEHISPTYAEIRNRVCKDNSEWLNSKMKSFMSQKLKDSNEEYSCIKKLITDGEMKYILCQRKKIELLARLRANVGKLYRFLVKNDDTKG